MKETIGILSTGGTFEKTYGWGMAIRNFSFPEISAIVPIIDRIGIRDVWTFYWSKLAKDSLDMTDDDRGFIAAWCTDTAVNRLIVIHGTDTMIDTARVIAERCLDKVVVLTGSLQPARMRDSDAEFNLGGAFIAVQICEPGVYIVMSGKVFPWDKCKKNPETGHFEPL